MSETARHPDRLMPAKEVAAELGISVKVLRKIVAAHRISARRHFNPQKGGKARLFFFESEVERYKRNMPDAVPPVKHRQSRERQYRNVTSGEIQFV